MGPSRQAAYPRPTQTTTRIHRRTCPLWCTHTPQLGRYSETAAQPASQPARSNHISRTTAQSGRLHTRQAERPHTRVQGPHRPTAVASTQGNKDERATHHARLPAPHRRTQASPHALACTRQQCSTVVTALTFPVLAQFLDCCCARRTQPQHALHRPSSPGNCFITRPGNVSQQSTPPARA